MFAKAKDILKNKTTPVQNYTDFKKVLEEKAGFLKVAWCGNSECEAKIKEETSCTIRVRPFQKEDPINTCIFCGQKAKETVYFARSY